MRRTQQNKRKQGHIGTGFKKEMTFSQLTLLLDFSLLVPSLLSMRNQTVKAITSRVSPEICQRRKESRTQASMKNNA